MAHLSNNQIETEITNAVVEVAKKLKIQADITSGSCPGDVIRSHILLTLMGRLQSTLGVTIPNNVYIFYDKKNHRQLTIKEAAQKLIKSVQNGNE